MKSKLIRRIPGTRALDASRTFLLCSVLSIWCSSSLALTLYRDSFQSYPVQNPAPNPLTNGPAGGQWYYVDPDSTTTANEHRIWDSTTVGSGLNSRVWVSVTNNARLTNAISLSLLPPAPTHTLRLSFVVATDTYDAARNITFGYSFSATAGTLTLVSAGNADGSQVLASAAGTAIATAGIKGKSPDRRFQFVFQAEDLTPADRFIFDITRITNNAGSSLNIVLDDVELLVDESTNAPVVLGAVPVPSLQHARITFSEPLEPASATNVANYSIPGLTVSNAWMLDSRQVEILTTEQTPGTAYTVTVSGVLGLNGAGVTATALGFTAPALGISPLRYNAGTTAGQPSGPPDPTSAEGNSWTVNVNNNAGMTKEPVYDDLGSGLHAWKITDNNSASSSGTIGYTTPIDPVSDVFARSNGWRITLRARYITNYGSTAQDHAVQYGDPALAQRFGLFFGITSTNTLYVTLLAGGGASVGNTYVLTDETEANNYHTHVLVFDAAKATASYYFDGRLVAADFGPQTGVSSVNGMVFGSGSSTAKGEMNYNLVQMDVVNASGPVVLRHPQSSTNGVGQKVTFSAHFTPFVNSYQWLSNDLPISGATGTNYTTGFISLANNGDQYKLRAYSAFGNVDTLPATMAVTDDTNPPVIVAVNASPMLDRIRITFSEPVLEVYATDPANYTWTLPGFSTVSAVMLDPLTVEVRGLPLTGASNYTVQVSNVRDTSNLVIANNSVASFRTPTLTALAKYYAGTQDDTPGGPPDPTSAAGGNWTHFLSPDPSLATNAIVNDGGLHAWQVHDPVTADNRQFNYYYLPLAAADHTAARQFGWVLSVRAKLIAGNSSGTSAIFAQYENDLFFRNILNFAFDPAADLRVGLGVTNAYENYVLTAYSTGMFDYHLHQIAYDPGTKTASYYFDGTLVRSGWAPVYIGSASTAAPLWGALASIPVGTANFNLFELAVVDGPILDVASSGSGIEVSYRGVLEATPQLIPAAWTAVATNANSAPAVYTVPQGGPSQQFFRAVGLR